jgi:hypothetical protein
MSHWESCLKSKPLVAAPLNVRHQLSALAISESPITSQHPSPITLSGSATPRVSPSTPTSKFTHQLNPLPPLFAHLPSLNVPDCPGFVVSVDRVFERYPLARHQGGDVGWIPVRIGDNRRDITVKSTKCLGSSAQGTACVQCTKTCSPGELKLFLQRISHASMDTPFEYLSLQQMLVCLKQYAQDNKALRTTVGNLEESLQVYREKLTMHDRIYALLATNNIPGLRRLIERAITVRKMSVEMLYRTLQKANAGLYRVRGGWNQLELDLAFLAKVASGPRFHGTIARAEGYATASSVRRKFDVPRLIVSVGAPSSAEINSNIQAFFTSSLLQPPIHLGLHEKRRHIGVVMMWDNIAIEQHCQWCPIRDCPIGLCREHAQHWPDLRIHNDEAILQMKVAIDQGLKADRQLCYGKEATVVAIAPIAPTEPTNSYHAVPVLVSPQCKHETIPELRKVLDLTSEAWRKHPEGERKHGPILNWASDGDGISRNVRHSICTEHSLRDVDPDLYNKLYPLHGLNLQVSATGAT